ncbi:MAG: hypothetical protein GY950_11300 [bacterium]|nr:hypothetical protein [bacterium]
MDIAYIEPLRQAYGRMKTALFKKPFDLNKWFVVGFTAFLAGLLEGPGGGGGGGPRGGGRHFDSGEFNEFLGFPGKAWDWLTAHPGWLIVIAVGLAIIIAVVITLTWLSSRGQFMFLDNVVYDRAEVRKPWHEFKNEGNSLCLWRLGFGLICFLIIILYVVFSFTSIAGVYEGDRYAPFPVGLVVGLGLLFVALVIAMAYISLFLTNFVVPIMYKYRVTATEAWGRFLALFKEHPFHFIFYGLFLLVVMILVGIIILAAGCATLCIGFILLIIPYIGSVVTLPVSYTLRAFSLEFLAQFGDDYKMPHGAGDPEEKPHPA